MKGKQIKYNRESLIKIDWVFSCHMVRTISICCSAMLQTFTFIVRSSGKILYSCLRESLAHFELHKFTLKRLSDTLWDAKTSSVKALQFQIWKIYDALIIVSEKDERYDSTIVHEAITLSIELQIFNFLPLLAIWYDLLFEINIVSTIVQGLNLDRSKGPY